MKCPGSADLIGKFYQTVKEKLIWILYNHIQNIEEVTLHTSFYEGSITLKPDRQIHNKKTIDQLFIMNIDKKVLSKILANKIQ